ncbi:MAG: hypothetical protein ACU843_00815 [Gammaproteobacteria bacterium]
MVNYGLFNVLSVGSLNRFRPYSRKQLYLLPASMNAWLRENHLARFVVEVVEQLDVSKITRRFSGCGAAAYHPAVLSALLMNRYVTEIVSSSKIERAPYEPVVFR